MSHYPSPPHALRVPEVALGSGGVAGLSNEDALGLATASAMIVIGRSFDTARRDDPHLLQSITSAMLRSGGRPELRIAVADGRATLKTVVCDKAGEAFAVLSETTVTLPRLEGHA